MAVYHTVDGQPYSVTAGTDVTVTDADGLILGVSAGGQGSFVGNGGDVTITGEHHFVQIKGGGGGGGNGGGGGEPFDGNLPDNDLRVGELGGDKKIYLNGQEIMQESTVIVDVVEANNANAVTSNAVFNALQEKQDILTIDPAPAQGSTNAVSSGGVYTALRELPAPTPETLVDGTELKHGHVYTVSAAGNTQSFGNVTVESNATAEIWITCSVDNSSVELPGSGAGWIWLDDMPDMKAGKTYGVAARNVGNAVIARPIYEYTTPAQS